MTTYKYDLIGYGVTTYNHSQLTGELMSITYHSTSREKVEKKASKIFPRYTISGCEDLGYTAYYIIK